MVTEPICPTKADFTIFYVYQLLSLLRANALDVDVFVDCLTTKNSINGNGKIKERVGSKRRKHKRTNRSRTYEANDALNTSQAASILGVSKGSLNNLRSAGGGPQYSKLGSRTIRYRYEDLLSFLEQNKFQNTSQYATADVTTKEVK